MTSVQKVARILNMLVMVTFICNLMALPLVPILVGIGSGYREFALQDAGTWTLAAVRQLNAYGAVLSGFLIFCGGCTAVVLWQGRRVLGTVLRGAPFAAENAVSLKRSAVCAFLIAGAALVRLVWNIFCIQAISPLASYNALFIPIFAMAGLLLLVMSALLRQAAELKAENDLTI